MGSSPKTLKTTETSLAVLEHLRERDGARVTEVARALDAAPSTVQGHLNTLRENEYVVKEGDVYYPGLRFLRLGRYVHDRKEEYRAARTYVEKLGRRTGCRALFAVEERGRAVILHTFSGEHAEWDHERLGNDLPIHATAVGKAILAALPRDRVETVVDDRGLPGETENTITDREALFEELESVRGREYATNDEENIPGMRAVGVAVTDRTGQVVGAFSVSGAARTLQGARFEEDLPAAALGIANEFELELSLA